jgi:hypothetical protein
MDSIRVKNLRCLVDSFDIPIKPLTILVGANSTGKSTFLRVFPLLRQSVETPTDNPILWYGQNGYVDFGTIKEALRESAQAISFGFKFTLANKSADDLCSHPHELGFLLGDGAGEFNIEIELTPRQNNETQTQISKLILRLGADEAILLFDESGQITRFDVNTRSFINELKPLQIKQTTHFIPIMFEKNSDLFNEYGLKLVKHLAHLYYKKTHPNSVLKMLFEMGIGHQNFITSFQEIKNPFKTWKKNISKLTESNENIQLIRDISFACHVPLLLSFADHKIVDFAHKIQYIGPLRAVADRYYRVQDISVAEIDFRGENLPMYLDSLSPNQKTDLDDWLKTHFGLEVSIQNQGTHLAVMVTPDNASLKNLADVGFGYSQALPVIIKLWSVIQRSLLCSKNFPSIIAIEQPELHLHPTLQAQLADVFANIAKMKLKNENQPTKSKVTPRILVETHSEAIVNRIGQLVGLGKLSADDVQVILFEPDQEKGGTKVSTTTFDEEGCLMNWPYGFFIPELPV